MFSFIIICFEFYDFGTFTRKKVKLKKKKSLKKATFFSGNKKLGELGGLTKVRTCLQIL